MSSFVVISSTESSYVRRVVRRLCESGRAPRMVLLGSKAHRVHFKLASFKRIRSQLGLKETFLRLMHSLNSTWDVPEKEPTISALQSKYGFKVQSFDAMNSGTILIALLEDTDTVALLAGAGLADRATIAAVRGRCINAHPALLPGIRGVDVLEWALLKGKPTGVSAHLVVPSVDAGDILKTHALSPLKGEKFNNFLGRILNLQADVLADAAMEYADGQALPIPHDLSQSELCFAASRRIRNQARAAFEKLASGESLPTGVRS